MWWATAVYSGCRIFLCQTPVSFLDNNVWRYPVPRRLHLIGQRTAGRQPRRLGSYWYRSSHRHIHSRLQLASAWGMYRKRVCVRQNSRSLHLLRASFETPNWLVTCYSLRDWCPVSRWFGRNVGVRPVPGVPLNVSWKTSCQAIR